MQELTDLMLKMIDGDVGPMDLLLLEPGQWEIVTQIRKMKAN